MSRKLDLSIRKECTREAKNVPVRFELSQIKSHFDESADSIKKQFIVFDRLVDEDKIDEAKNILRSQIIFLEGILDFYLHEISKYAICQIFENNWATTDKYQSFLIPMKHLQEALTSTDSTDWLFKFLNDRFSRDVFLSVESMKEQLNLIGIPFAEVMEKVFPNSKNSQQESVAEGRNTIRAMFERRNCIAHQLDRNHNSAEQNDINKTYVENYMQTIISLVKAIHEIAVDKN